MIEEISNKCWGTTKEMASSYQLPRQESEEEEEDSAMAALMRSTDKEIEESCGLVREVIKDRKKKREETIIKFKELFEKWKGGEPIEQIQAEHDERLLGYWSNLSRIPKAAAFSRVAQVVLSCPVTSASSERLFSYSEPCDRKNISSNRFSTLAFIPLAIKFKKIYKSKSIKNITKHQK